MSSPLPESPAPGHGHAVKPLALTLGALGVVFGDIGTSPLYTMQECLRHLPGQESLVVLGLLSLLLWALILVVSVKYLVLVMRAENRGEGGIFAMLGLLGDRASDQRFKVSRVVLMMMVGAALLYGDGVITPAISVLGATEGLVSIHHGLEPLVVPLAAVILLGLFAVQFRGAGSIGRVFGPAMLIWFSTIGLFGLWRVWEHPAVLAAVNPWLGVQLLLNHPQAAVPLLGGVVLAITGAEALYADMGHFGRRAIQRAWYGVVLPGLALNYFGQGAFVLAHPGLGDANPFYAMVPAGLRLGFVVLAMGASIIASQALISGVFSLTRQAIQLGCFPRVLVRHTNPGIEGQIYLPTINWLLALGAIALVLGFRSTGELASAYGIAVTGTMAITTLALMLVARQHWQWGWLRITAVLGGFLAIDLLFFGANLDKLLRGGWVPVLIGAAMFIIMHAWKTGRSYIARTLYADPIEPRLIVMDLESGRIPRCGHAAVFMASNPQGVPLSLLHHIKASGSLHETVVLLTLETVGDPFVRGTDRITVIPHGQGVWQVVARYGYMQTPHVPSILRFLARRITLNPAKAYYFFSRENVYPTGHAPLWIWQKAVYGFLARIARPARDYFGIPPSQIVEMGLPVDL